MSFILKGKCKSIETILYFQKTAISFLFLCFIFAKKNTFLFTFIIIVININTNQCLKCEVFLLGYCRWEINPNGTLRVESCKPLVYTNEWITSKVTDASRMALIQNRLVSLLVSISSPSNGSAPIILSKTTNYPAWLLIFSARNRLKNSESATKMKLSFWGWRW